MATYRTTGDLYRNSTARMADETPSPQRLPAAPPVLSPERLRQLAADRRSEADGLQRHLRSDVMPYIRSSTQAKINRLRQEARAFEQQATEVQQ